jgi:hypothetical protein
MNWQPLRLRQSVRSSISIQQEPEVLTNDIFNNFVDISYAFNSFFSALQYQGVLPINFQAESEVQQRFVQQWCRSIIHEEAGFYDAIQTWHVVSMRKR